jgi:hypothetical protein
MAETQEWMAHPEVGTPEASISRAANSGEPEWMSHPEVPPAGPGTASGELSRAAAKPMSRVVHVTDEGFPIFEDEEDNRAARRAVAGMFKEMPLGVGRGMVDVPEGILQLGARSAEAMLPEGSSAQKFMKGQREGFERFQKEGEEGYQATRSSPDGPDIGRIGGNIAASAPIAMVMPGANAATLLPRIASGAASGAVTGAAQPQPVEAPDQDFWSQKAAQTGIGAAGGAGAPVLAGATARLISPKTAPDVKTLLEAGVRPTPGQILGGSANRIEEAARSIPLVGDAIKSARGRAVQDFNRASINRALEPIGEKLNADTPLGRDAIAEMGDKISANYDKLVPTLHIQADRQLASDMMNVHGTLRARMSDPARKQFDRIMDHDVINKFDPGLRMTGENFKTVESELTRQAASFSGSAIASERQVGQALSAVRQAFRDTLMRSNPDKATELSALNNAFAHSVRVEGAAKATGTDQGIFTPAHLQQSIKSSDPSIRGKQFARGEALMQDLSDAGKSVLGSKVPDSGTPLRSMVAGGAAGPALAGLYMVNPAAAAGTAAGAAGVMGAYSRPGVSLLAKLLASRGDMAAPTANLIRNPISATLPAILAQERLTGRGQQ